LGSGGKQHVSCVALGALSHDVIARLEGARREQADFCFSGCLDVLEHHDRVGACGNRGSGHDLPGCSWRQRAGWGITGAGSSADGHWRVSSSLGGAAGVAVASGSGEGGLIAISHERLGEDASGCLAELYGFLVGQ